jgi:hypothetical protein
MSIKKSKPKPDRLAKLGVKLVDESVRLAKLKQSVASLELRLRNLTKIMAELTDEVGIERHKSSFVNADNAKSARRIAVSLSAASMRQKVEQREQVRPRSYAEWRRLNFPALPFVGLSLGSSALLGEDSGDGLSLMLQARKIVEETLATGAEVVPFAVTDKAGTRVLTVLPAKMAMKNLNEIARSTPLVAYGSAAFIEEDAHVTCLPSRKGSNGVSVQLIYKTKVVAEDVMHYAHPTHWYNSP